MRPRCAIARTSFATPSTSSAPYYPRWIRTVVVEKSSGTVKHVVCDDAATLAYLANLACVTPHVWLSRTDKLDFPDQMVFDLDPPEGRFELAKRAAQALKELLDGLELPAYVKTTGSRGLHVAVPLKRREGFDAVRAFGRDVARVVASEAPGERTLEQRKSRRRNRVFLDTNRNAYAQTLAPAYAVRARGGAPVAVPLDWDALRKSDLRSDGVTIRSVFDRLDRVGDPWSDFWQRRVSLSGARRRLELRDVARRLPAQAELR